jgi:trimeric autotransporter adhesin
MNFSGKVCAILLALTLTSCGGFFVANDTVTQLAVSPVNPTVQVGATSQFTATGTTAVGNTIDVTPGVSWSSSKPAIATVNSAGLLTGVSAGISIIYASYQQGSTQTIATVTSATLISLAIAPLNTSISVGATQQYTATGTYSDNSTQDLTGSVSWSSSNVNVATISTTGLATGVSSGSTTIAAAINGLTAQTTLSVN